MKLYSANENYKLYQGNMLDMLEVIELNSIDSIITDPPYGLTSITKRFGKENSAPAQYGKDGSFARLSKGFMGKEWDGSGIEYNIDTWKKCYEVLKPGGYLLAFGGSRTFHRIACAIEDAGFEIRDTIMWLYGCYSNDTQVLTDKGWKYFYELDKTEKILQWDSEKDILSWVKPLNYFEYDIDDEMILLENRHTSQLLSKNHNVYARVQKNERKQVNGIRKYISKKDEKYQPYKAEDLKNNWNISLPLASRLDGNLDCEYAYMLGWWVTDAWKHNDGKACMFSQSKPKTLLKLRNELDRLKQLGKCNYSEYVKDDKNLKHNKEHTFYVTGEVADWLLNNYSDRELNWNLLNFNLKNKQQLLEGLMDGDGSYRKNSYSKIFWSQKENRCDIISALLTCLGYRNYIFNKGRHQGVVFNSVHSSTEISYKHRKPLQEYHGKIYCLETETGAFVVRRNGKPFISGNSGFPKSMNIGLAMDKREGVESKIVGQNQDILKKQAKDLKEGHRKIVDSFNAGAEDRNNGFTTVSADIKEPVSEDGKKWKGWGTALKPSFEPIIVARKPFRGSLVDNIIKYGVGGINIDECRVEAIDKEELQKNWTNRKAPAGFNGDKNGIYGSGKTDNPEKYTPNGRFPANTILTYNETDFDEVCGGFPNTKSVKSARGGARNDGTTVYNKIPQNIKMNYECGFNDSGSASRYFYCAKASKRDRDEGLEGFDSKVKVFNGKSNKSSVDIKDVEQRFTTECRNIHPTVKPTNLMQYLVRLVTPNGGTVLDPFNGSGSTGKAVMYENQERNKNYKYIGIELTEEYLPIAKARIEYVINQKQELTPIEEYIKEGDDNV